MTVVHQLMWYDIEKDGMPVVGRFYGEPGPEVRTLTKIPCPLCQQSLYQITGYTERIIIMALRGKPVNGRQCAEVHDIPADFDILSCKECLHNFTTEK